MSKINLIIIIIFSSLLSACSFHTPTKITTLNAVITGKVNSVFATKLKTYFDVEAAQSFTIQIGNEVQNKRTVTYLDGIANSYTLTLGIPVKIFRNKKLLLSKTLIANATIEKLPTTQTNRLQIDISYMQLRKTIMTKLLRRLRYLNEN